MVDKKIATGVTENDKKFFPSQSGTFDTDILCIKCDGTLGMVEGEAIETFREIRKKATAYADGALVDVERSAETMLRFCASILYKYSITKKEYGRISLGRYQEPMRRAAFGESDVPDFLNAALLRLRLNRTDESVFAYRAPKADREQGTGANMYRIFAGGVLLFVRVDQRAVGDSALKKLWLYGREKAVFSPFDARKFEEFKIPQRQIHEDEGLAKFLPD